MTNTLDNAVKDILNTLNESPKRYTYSNTRPFIVLFESEAKELSTNLKAAYLAESKQPDLQEIQTKTSNLIKDVVDLLNNKDQPEWLRMPSPQKVLTYIFNRLTDINTGLVQVTTTPEEPNKQEPAGKLSRLAYDVGRLESIVYDATPQILDLQERVVAIERFLRSFNDH